MSLIFHWLSLALSMLGTVLCLKASIFPYYVIHLYIESTYFRYMQRFEESGWKKKNEVASRVPEFRHRHSYHVSLLFAAPIPTIVIFLRFLPLVHALFLSKRHHEFTTPEIMHAHPPRRLAMSQV